MEWANYLAWQLDGRAPVFVEGHVELYPPEVWAQYLAINDARPGWRDVLDRFGVRFLLLDQTYQATLLSEVRRSGQWEPRAVAGRAVLFERSAGVPPASGGVAGTGDGNYSGTVAGTTDFSPTR
jgi:hypothetical protein